MKLEDDWRAKQGHTPLNKTYALSFKTSLWSCHISVSATPPSACAPPPAPPVWVYIVILRAVQRSLLLGGVYGSGRLTDEPVHQPSKPLVHLRHLRVEDCLCGRQTLEHGGVELDTSEATQEILHTISNVQTPFYWTPYL